jgi:hypothetical protein
MQMLKRYEGKGFWKRPTTYKPGEQLTEKQISEIEEFLDVELPQPYISLMKEQNGGELYYRYVLFNDGQATLIPYFQELDLETGVGLSSIFSEQLHLPNHQLLLTGDTHTWITLDYRSSDTPKVCYFTELEDGRWAEELIAETFEDFLLKLFTKE